MTTDEQTDAIRQFAADATPGEWFLSVGIHPAICAPHQKNTWSANHWIEGRAVKRVSNKPTDRRRKIVRPVCGLTVAEREQFARDNLGFIYHMAGKYAVGRTDAEYADFVSAGMEGMAVGLSKYDRRHQTEKYPGGSVPILNYVGLWVRQRMQALCRAGVGDASYRFGQRVRGKSDSPDLLDQLPDRAITGRWDDDDWRELLRYLTPRERYAVSKRFREGWPMADIAAQLKVTHQRAQQLIANGLDRLRVRIIAEGV